MVVKQDSDSAVAAIAGVTSTGAPIARSSRSGKRPVYPFSIVPGGVGSREELKTAMQKDPLVARHDASVDVDGLKPVTLRQNLAAYVSFRKHGQVYWTSRKVRLAKGERLLQGSSQGVRVRERCGNQVAEQPQTPVLKDLGTEPSGATFDTPLQPLAPALRSSVSAASPIAEPSDPLDNTMDSRPYQSRGSSLDLTYSVALLECLSSLPRFHSADRQSSSRRSPQTSLKIPLQAFRQRRPSGPFPSLRLWLMLGAALGVLALLRSRWSPAGT